MPVVKDLVVDMEPFFASYRAIKPFLINNDQHRRRTAASACRSAEDATASTTRPSASCARVHDRLPDLLDERQYFGPATIVQAHRFIYDSRDQGAEERLGILNEKSGVWRCRTIFNCTDACPRDIQVTQAIAEVKQAVLRGRP